MKLYLASACVGLLVGIIYGLLNVRTPAPPVVALVGLLGILMGEQLVPLAKRLLSGQPVTVAWAKQQCVSHIFGQLPGSTVGATDTVTIREAGPPCTGRDGRL
jgi:XapX domain-containing protein